MHVLISAVSSARHPSGICRHAANLATSLANAPEISRLTLLVGRWQANYFREAFGLKGCKAEVVAVDVKNTPYARNAWYYFQLPKFARRRGADIVHLSFPVPIRRSAFACPVVLSLHDMYPYDVPENFGRVRVLFNRAFLQQCLRASDAIACSSNFTLDRLRQRMPELALGKARRIYQSVALDPGHEQAPASSKQCAQPFLLAVAQHRSNKNLDLLLSAFAEFRRCHPFAERMRLIIVGSNGPETGKLKSLVQRLALYDQVSFESDLSDAELCWLYRRCELLVVPSSVEGFCFPVVEALRCGARVLCSDIPVLREVGGASCHYFDLQQRHPTAALAKAIEEVLHQPLAKTHVSDALSGFDTARQYHAVYSSLAGSQALSTTAVQEVCDDPVRYDGYAS